MLIGAAVLTARLVMGATWEPVMTQNRNETPYARMREFVRQLPTITHTPRSALYLGVCYAERGFMPEAFDAQLATHQLALHTYSIAIASMHTSTTRALSERVAAAYREAGTHPELILVELPSSAMQPESNEAAAGVPPGYNRTLRGLLLDQVSDVPRAFGEAIAFGSEVVGNQLLGGPTKNYTAELLCGFGLNVRCPARAPDWWPWQSDDPGVALERAANRLWESFVPSLLARSGPHALSWSLDRQGFISRRPPNMTAAHDEYLRLHQKIRHHFYPTPTHPDILDYGWIMGGAQRHVGHLGLRVATAQKIQPLLESPRLLAQL